MPGALTWFGAKARRRLLVAVYAVAVAVAILLAVIFVAAIAFRSEFSISDRLSAINDVIAGAALILALTTGIIALQSYAAATGNPEIQIQAWLGDDIRNRLVVLASMTPEGLLRSVDIAGQTSLHIRLRNVSRYDAAHLAVTLQFRNVFFEQQFGKSINEWQIVDALADRKSTAAEWISRSVLHGHATRRLPELDLTSIVSVPGSGPCSVAIYLASTSYSRKVDIPVEFVLQDVVNSLAPSDVQEWL